MIPPREHWSSLGMPMYGIWTADIMSGEPLGCLLRSRDMKRVLLIGIFLVMILAACGEATSSGNGEIPSQYNVVTVYTAPT